MLKIVCFWALECWRMLYICVRCDGCFFSCLYCDAWSSRYTCMESVSISSCRCYTCVSRVHPVAVFNAAFCMTCSLLMLVKDEEGNHMEEMIGFGLYQSRGNRESVGRVSVFGLKLCVWYWGKWVCGLVQGLAE